MTLLFMDGFAQPDIALKPGWNIATMTKRTGRFGGNAALPIAATATASFTASSAAVIAGVAYITSATSPFGGTSNCVLSLASDGGITRHLTVNFTAAGQVQLRRGNSSGTVIATSTYAQTVGAWVYYEMRATIADSGGTCVVRADGVEIINYTGDTRNAGTSTDIDAVVIAGASASVESFDDLYVLNTAGSAPYNDYLGDIKIETVIPTGNGAASQWVGSDGNSVDNYLLVDDPTANTSDYTGSSVVGDRDLYTMSDLVTTSGSVLAVQALAYVQKSDAGAASVKALLRSSGGTVAASAARVLSASWTMVAGDLRTTDPDGAGWTIASVNGLQSGVETA